MSIAFIGLGSNLGDRAAYLRWALDRLAQLPQTQLIQVSSWIETDPAGGPPQGKYLNGVAKLETQLPPAELLLRLQQVEAVLGRPRNHLRWGPRVIDLDLLAYDEMILQEPTLTLPHPRLHERPFVLIPWAEIAPEWIHPRLNRSLKELLEALPHANSQAAA